MFNHKDAKAQRKEKLCVFASSWLKTVQLPKEQFQKLFEALIDAFENDDSLRELARTASDKHLDRISTASGTERKLRELIECAERENWVGKLIATACELRPTHAKLAQFCQDLQANL